MGESRNAIPTEIIAARDASAIDLKAIRQAMNEPESSCASRLTVISCESNVNM